MERLKLNTSSVTGTAGGLYFSSPSAVSFIPSGCTVLDCVLGGGYALGRVANIVGDKSTGKTLLAIEAAANFLHKFPKGSVWYNEVEAAFDREYALALGMPFEGVNMVDGCLTVEDVFKHLSGTLEKRPKDSPGLYILDSLDALSDKAELERGFDEGTYGMGKAKQMSQLFRRLTQKLESSSTSVIIISQVRDNIGVTFGKKVTRTGGRALDFYASQVLFLSQMGTRKETSKGIERATGIQIRAKCEKNKVALPLRECQFSLVFGYGIQNAESNIDWLASVGRADLLGLEKSATKRDLTTLKKSLSGFSDDEYLKVEDDLNNHVNTLWVEIEKGFLPKRKKYTSWK